MKRNGQKKSPLLNILPDASGGVGVGVGVEKATCVRVCACASVHVYVWLLWRKAGGLAGLAGVFLASLHSSGGGKQ